MTDSKLPDGQAGYEKALTNALAGLAGANYVGESAGMQASLMGCSFEALVIDNDMLGAVARTVRGIEVTEETLSFEVMEDVALGAGHYLGTEQTLALMESEYHYPEIADRSAYGLWESNGSPDIREAAEVPGRARSSRPTTPAISTPRSMRKSARASRSSSIPADMAPGCGRW